MPDPGTLTPAQIRIMIARLDEIYTRAGLILPTVHAGGIAVGSNVATAVGEIRGYASLVKATLLEASVVPVQVGEETGT